MSRGLEGAQFARRRRVPAPRRFRGGGVGGEHVLQPAPAEFRHGDLPPRRQVPRQQPAAGGQGGAAAGVQQNTSNSLTIGGSLRFTGTIDSRGRITGRWINVHAYGDSDPRTGNEIGGVAFKNIFNADTGGIVMTGSAVA